MGPVLIVSAPKNSEVGRWKIPNRTQTLVRTLCVQEPEMFRTNFSVFFTGGKCSISCKAKNVH